MKNKIQIIIMTACLFLASCSGLVDGINDNPNELTLTEVNAELFLTGAQLANILVQNGHLNRISGLYSGQLVGISSLYSNIYGYSLSTAESNGAWNRIYIGVIPNLRQIRELVPNDNLLVGISKIIEANAIGTGASLFGDIPYAEIYQVEIEDPKFDSQTSVLTSAINLLDEAINDLGGAISRDLPQDIHFEGEKDPWIEVAWTLKARYHLLKKEYDAAYTAAQNGVSAASNSMLFIPRGDPSIAEGDKNLFWEILEGSRAGDIGTEDSYMIQLIDDASTVYRGNDKTLEAARLGYYSIDPSGGAPNSGVIEQFEPMPMVTYSENSLILAEAGARSQSFDVGLGHLNDHRDYLNNGGRLNANFDDSEFYEYVAYESADFANGGMENEDGIDADRALLREIIEERFISLFGTYSPFNDARRLRKNDADVSVPFPFNTSTATAHPERMPYANDELNSNENGPDEDPGIFMATEVNR